jgi:AGCS family alanine or glycine:cation symporter
MVIGTTAVANPGFAGDLTGIAMTSAAFESQISWFPIPLAFAGMLFAFSTMISWSYYGLKGWTYLFGEGANGQMIYKIILCVRRIGVCCSVGPNPRYLRYARVLDLRSEHSRIAFPCTDSEA